MSEPEKGEKEDQGLGNSDDSVVNKSENRGDSPINQKDTNDPTQSQRQSRWHTTLKAFRFVQSVSDDEDIRIRDTDKVTSIALLIATICLLLSPWINPLGKIRTSLLCLCDVLAGIGLIFYITNRFGIINTFNRRQALLTWQLIMAGVYCGAFLTINLAVIIALATQNIFRDLRP